MKKMVRQPPIRRIAVADSQHPLQLYLQLSAGGPQAVLGNLAPLIAIPQGQAGLEQIAHGPRKSGRSGRGDQRHRQRFSRCAKQL
jgi:hypothetical protein